MLCGAHFQTLIKCFIISTVYKFLKIIVIGTLKICGILVHLFDCKLPSFSISSALLLMDSLFTLAKPSSPELKEANMGK